MPAIEDTTASISPPTSETRAADAPLYGTCVTLMPASDSISAVVRWFEDPIPPEPKFSFSGLLRASISELYSESDAYPIYEGSVGASPREMRGVLLDAAQNPRFSCLSPLAVLDELDDLCENRSEYGFLEEEKLPGGYHDHALFRRTIRERLLDAFEDEFRVASGLVDEARYNELFDRYITHVSFWIKGEKLRNPMTGQYEEPDDRLMREVEALLGRPERPEDFRHGLIGTIAAWAIDHPGEHVENTVVFADHLRRLREAVFADRRTVLARLCRDILILQREEGSGLDEARRSAATRALNEMQKFGYDERSAGDAAAALVRERFHQMLS